MKEMKLKLKKYWRCIIALTVITIMLFSVNKTISGYKTDVNISTSNALPLMTIEPIDSDKELGFEDYGDVTYNFDVINGKTGKDGKFHVNEVDMEYYIKVVEDSKNLSLELKGLYIKNDDSSLSDPLAYVEGKGYGPFDLPYKKDDELVLNSSGIYESKYLSKVNYMLVYNYGVCEDETQDCILDAREAGKAYNFHIEIKAYQKVND